MSAPSLRRQAALDAFVTAVFVAIAASFVELGQQLGPLVHLSAGGTSLGLTLLLLVGLVPLCERLGGALFNPANNGFLYALGQGTAWEHTVRSAAQAVGGVVGALMAEALLPPSWTKHLGVLAIGLRPGVGLLEGAACEFVLGALLAFIALWAGQLKNRVFKLWIPLIATVAAVRAGAPISGPSLNPVYTFAWVFIYARQSPLEHLFVYWMAPIASGVFGGWAFRGYAAFQAEKQQQLAARGASQRNGRASAVQRAKEE